AHGARMTRRRKTRVATTVRETPAEAVASLAEEKTAPSGANVPISAAGVAPAAQADPPSESGNGMDDPGGGGSTRAAALGMAVAEAKPQPAGIVDAPPPEPAKPDPASFNEIVDLALEKKEMILAANLGRNVHLVHFEPGKIEFRPTETAPNEMAHDLSRFLNTHTARRWLVTISGEQGEPTLQERKDAAEAARKSDAAKNELVQAVMDTFPGAEVTAVRPAESDEGDGEDPLAD
ncbi:MAG: hypothetical protein MI741_14470, partial [Rhodospirillales bacterium]|nr:hypothetical protein [Rhodospirillales bacterium]